MKGYRVANNKVTDNSNVHQHSPYTDQIVFINRAKTGVQWDHIPTIPGGSWTYWQEKQYMEDHAQVPSWQTPWFGNNTNDAKTQQYGSKIVLVDHLLITTCSLFLIRNPLSIHLTMIC